MGTAASEKRKHRARSSALRPSQASAAELVAGGYQIAIPAKQPLVELTQGPVNEYALSASPAQIDSEESSLLEWAAKNHRIFPPEEIAGFEQQAGPQGGGSEHDAWVVMGKGGKVVIRRTINDSYGFRFSSPFQRIDKSWYTFRFIQAFGLQCLVLRRRYPDADSGRSQERIEHDLHDMEYLALGLHVGSLATADVSPKLNKASLGWRFKLLEPKFQLVVPSDVLVPNPIKHL